MINESSFFYFFAFDGTHTSLGVNGMDCCVGSDFNLAYIDRHGLQQGMCKH